MQIDKIKDTVTLYPHQVDCVKRSVHETSMLIADEMGLGKTLEALTIAAIDFQVGRATRVLVVTPATLKFNWQAEIDGLTNFSAEVLNGTPDRRAEQLLDWAAGEGSDILIVNYEQVKPHLNVLNKLRFDIVIFDEAHYLKNPRAARTKACHKLQARRFFPMTGSPVLNKVDELWSLLHIVAPRKFPGYWAFKNRYCLMGGFQGKVVVGVQHEKELTEKLSKVMIRRTKDEVLDLPEKLHIPIVVEMGKKQRALYDEIYHQWRYSVPDDPTPQEIAMAMTQLLRLKQVCSTPANLEHPDNSAKLDVAVDRAREIADNGKPVVLFTQFRGTLRALTERLASTMQTYQLHGDVSMPNRQQTVETWKFAGGALCAMIQVAGVGLTLTAADTVIFIDKLWTPKLNEQAEDRLHRIGQKNTVSVLDIIAADSIEWRIEQILREKTELFDSIVGGAANWQGDLVRELKNA